MNYSFVDGKTKASYSAKNVSTMRTDLGADAGLNVRLVNSGNFHVFVEAGGSLQDITMTYDFANATGGAGAATPVKSETVTGVGTYAKVGFDLIFFNGYGLRAFARAANESVSAMQALSDQTTSYVRGEGWAGIIKQF